MTDGSHVSAYLMGSSGEQVDLHQAEMIDRIQHFVVCANGLAALRALFFYIDAVLLLVLFKVAFQRGFRRNRPAADDA